MKNNYYVTKNYNTTFGGKIYNYDFDGYESMSDVANRIISDWKIDEKCRKNLENKGKLK